MNFSHCIPLLFTIMLHILWLYVYFFVSVALPSTFLLVLLCLFTIWQTTFNYN